MKLSLAEIATISICETQEISTHTDKIGVSVQKEVCPILKKRSFIRKKLFIWSLTRGSSILML